MYEFIYSKTELFVIGKGFIYLGHRIRVYFKLKFELSEAVLQMLYSSWTELS
jgi:hypothetical protein